MGLNFAGTWGKRSLPISGKVAIVDQGERNAVGLSAMQMANLDVGNGVVEVGFNGKTALAIVWNAGGPVSTRKADEIRVTEGLALALGCNAGDLVSFLKVTQQISSVRVRVEDM